MKTIRGNVVRNQPTVWYRMKVLGRLDTNSTEAWGELTDPYDLREAYKNAHGKNNPYLAPHGLFLKLHNRNSFHAKEFLEEFGPLFLDVGKRLYGRGAAVRVDLQEFWGLHLRFSLVAGLWENLNRRDQLSEILSTIYRRRRELSQWDTFPVAVQFSPPPSKRRSQFKFPWQERKLRMATWLNTASNDELHECALALLHLELNAHMCERRIYWQRGWELTREKFRPVIWVDSLWSTIWEFFGTDTTRIAWRRCPHCQQLIYPKRSDQFYCTPRQQALASKRNYASRMRQAQRRKVHRRSRS